MKTDMHAYLITDTVPHFSDGIARLRGISPVTAAEALAQAEQNGCDSVLLSGWPYPDPDRCRAQNEALLSTMREYPDRVSALAVVSPEHPAEAEAEARKRLAEGFSGIGELDPTAQGFDLGSPVLDVLAALCAEQDAWLSFYTSFSVGDPYPGKSRILPVQWMTFIEAHPETKILLTHYGAGLPFYGLMPEVMRKLANVSFTTNPDGAVWREGIYACAARCLGGEEKLLYGSGWPLNCAFEEEVSA